MRISDWSSDVCSSDLSPPSPSTTCARRSTAPCRSPKSAWCIRAAASPALTRPIDAVGGGSPGPHHRRSEERRVGKECVIRVDLGGRRIIKKKKQHNYSYNLLQLM